MNDAELQIACDLAVRAGQNHRLTDTVHRLTGAAPRGLLPHLREHLADVAPGR